MSSDEFIRIGDAVRLLAFHLGQRFASNGHAHLARRATSCWTLPRARFRDRGRHRILSVAASFPLRPNAWKAQHRQHRLDDSIFDASTAMPYAARNRAAASFRSRTLWVPKASS